MESSVESNFETLKHLVQFMQVPEYYYRTADITCFCKYKDYIPKDGDIIALFKIGWTQIKSYLLSELVPTKSFGPSGISTVVFKKEDLLNKEINQYYQFCYLNKDHELIGASSAFQLVCEKEKFNATLSLLGMEESVYESFPKTNKVPNIPDDKDNEIKKIDKANETIKLEYVSEIEKLKDENNMLKEENSVLKVALKTALKFKSISQTIFQDITPSTSKNDDYLTPNKNYGEEIAQLKQCIETLRHSLAAQSYEIELLHAKISNIREDYVKLNLRRDSNETKEAPVEQESKPGRSSESVSSLGSTPPQLMFCE